jgi:hypothetical protein
MIWPSVLVKVVPTVVTNVVMKVDVENAILIIGVVVTAEVVVAVYDVKIHVEKPVVCRVVVLCEVSTFVEVEVVDVVVTVVLEVVVEVVVVAVVIVPTARKFDAKSWFGVPVTVTR